MIKDGASEVGDIILRSLAEFVVKILVLGLVFTGALYLFIDFAF